MTTIGERLRTAIKAKGLSIRKFQEQFAKENLDLRGVSHATTMRYVQGGSEPSIAYLEAAADFLSVRVEWLTRGEGPQTAQEAVVQPDSGVIKVTDTGVGVYDIEAAIRAGAPVLSGLENYPVFSSLRQTIAKLAIVRRQKLTRESMQELAAEVERSITCGDLGLELDMPAALHALADMIRRLDAELDRR